MKRYLLFISGSVLLFLMLVRLVYMQYFMVMSDSQISTYGWKYGEGQCKFQDNHRVVGDVIDFRNPAFTIQHNIIYLHQQAVLKVVRQGYRIYAEPVIELINLKTHKNCIYLGKWRN